MEIVTEIWETQINDGNIVLTQNLISSYNWNEIKQKCTEMLYLSQELER